MSRTRDTLRTDLDRQALAESDNPARDVIAACAEWWSRSLAPLEGEAPISLLRAQAAIGAFETLRAMADILAPEVLAQVESALQGAHVLLDWALAMGM